MSTEIVPANEPTDALKNASKPKRIRKPKTVAQPAPESAPTPAPEPMIAPPHVLRSLAEKQGVIASRITQCVVGRATGLYLCGRPGTSKTFMVKSRLEAMGAPYHFEQGQITPLALFNAIANHNDKVIVLDDVSAIFKTPVGLQIFLAALGRQQNDTNERVIRWASGKDIREVVFKGSIIAISNKHLSGHNDDVLAALRDRIQILPYEPTEEEIMSMCEMVAHQGVRDISPKECRQVLEFVKSESVTRKVPMSMRIFMDKALEDYSTWKADLVPIHWKDLVRHSVIGELSRLTQPTVDRSRAERTAYERRIALSIYLEHETREARNEAWTNKVKLSEKSFYRRIAELRKEGKLDGLDDVADDLDDE